MKYLLFHTSYCLSYDLYVIYFIHEVKQWHLRIVISCYSSDKRHFQYIETEQEGADSLRDSAVTVTNFNIKNVTPR